MADTKKKSNDMAVLAKFGVVLAGIGMGGVILRLILLGIWQLTLGRNGKRATMGDCTATGVSTMVVTLATVMFEDQIGKFIG